MLNSNIGVGIVTCNRENYLRTLLDSVKGNRDVSELVIVNDGEELSEDIRREYNVITNSINIGVGKTKNNALRFLLEKKCNNIFLIEDDIKIKDSNVFKRYIETSVSSGIQHFNFAFHGVDNYLPTGEPAVRLRVEYSDSIAVCFYPNVYGAFSYFTRHCLEKCGIMDEYYYNAMEHVDHTNEIIKNGMHPPFRWFADIADSHLYIQELDVNHNGSEIRKDQKWVENFHRSADYFAKKHNFDVRVPSTVQATKDVVVTSLKQLKKIYGRVKSNE